MTIKISLERKYISIILNLLHKQTELEDDSIYADLAADIEEQLLSNVFKGE